jgi:hypothetical protein
MRELNVIGMLGTVIMTSEDVCVFFFLETMDSLCAQTCHCAIEDVRLVLSNVHVTSFYCIITFSVVFFLAGVEGSYRERGE